MGCEENGPGQALTQGGLVQALREACSRCVPRRIGSFCRDKRARIQPQGAEWAKFGLQSYKRAGFECSQIMRDCGRSRSWGLTEGTRVRSSERWGPFYSPQFSQPTHPGLLATPGVHAACCHLRSLHWLPLCLEHFHPPHIQSVPSLPSSHVQIVVMLSSCEAFSDHLWKLQYPTQSPLHYSMLSFSHKTYHLIICFSVSVSLH